MRLHRDSQHSLSGEGDEVKVERLGDERERAARAQVALDHLDVVVAREELDVERPRDLQLLHDLAHGLSSSSQHIIRQGLRR